MFGWITGCKTPGFQGPIYFKTEISDEKTENKQKKYSPNYSSVQEVLIESKDVIILESIE